jgi:hypothetical protein
VQWMMFWQNPKVFDFISSLNGPFLEMIAKDDFFEQISYFTGVDQGELDKCLFRPQNYIRCQKQEEWFDSKFNKLIIRFS